MKQFRDALDWGRLAPLRLRARVVADGLFAGAHASARRGAGVEFGGHRAYLPGDDLRWLDHRALLRHDRLLVREFETETDRALRLVLDASASMGYRSERGPGAKLAFAAVVAAALARIALSAGDPVALDWVAGEGLRRLPAAGGREAFERILGALEDARAGGDLHADPEKVVAGLVPVARGARRGTSVVVLSDLLDLPPGSLEAVTALGSRGRTVIVVRVLDPLEATLDLDGPVRLRATESGQVVETDAGAARAGYLERLHAQAATWRTRLRARGGDLVEAVTTDDPVNVVRAVVEALGGRRA